MEKALLVTILVGLLYLALRRLVKAKSAVVNKDEAEDWSKYDVPAFIRRGIPMPKLDPLQQKTAKTRKRKAKAESAVTRAASDTATFEVVA